MAHGTESLFEAAHAELTITADPVLRKSQKQEATPVGGWPPQLELADCVAAGIRDPDVGPVEGHTVRAGAGGEGSEISAVAWA